MEKLITTITDGRMPDEMFQADELIGKGNLTFADGEEMAGFARVALSEFKLRFYPNEEPQHGEVPLNAERFDATTLQLALTQPTLDVFFRFDGAKLDLNYVYSSTFMRLPLEYRFARCIFGPSVPPNTFSRAIFRFAGMGNLIGSNRFKFINAGRDVVHVERPEDLHITGISENLALEVDLHSQATFGYSSDKPAVSLNRHNRAVARFKKPMQIENLLDRVHTFITFASILRGVQTSVTDMKLDCDGDLFQFVGRFVKPVDDDGDDDELSLNRGVLSDAIVQFERFAEYDGKNDAFDTLATVPTHGGYFASWATVALLSVAEGLVGMFERRNELRVWNDKGTKKREMHLAEKLQLIRDQVRSYFMEIPSDQWLKDVAGDRNAQMHEAKDPFQLTRAEKVIQRTNVLRSLLRAYVLHKCEVPPHIIIKALRGSGRGTNFLDLRPKPKPPAQ